MVPLLWVSAGVPILYGSKIERGQDRAKAPTQRWHAVCHWIPRAGAHRSGYPIRRIFDRSMRQVRSPS
jgi:hypothetical protein